MKKYVSRDKLSKKLKRELDSKRRASWGAISPVTRKSENKKLYNRKRTGKRDFEAFAGSFCGLLALAHLGAPVKLA